MNQKKELISKFFDQKHIAIIGLSDTKKGPANAVYDKLEKAGYQLSAISRSLTEYHNKPCFHSLHEISQKPDAVFIATNPTSTEFFTNECIDLGIQLIWMHDLSGTSPKKRNSLSSVHTESVKKASEQAIKVIDGSCPMQHLNPDFAHKCFCGINSLLGRNN